MTEHRVSWVRRIGLVVTVASTVAMAVAVPVEARSWVDPATLNPPIPDFVNPHCGWSGGQVICSVDRTFTITDAPTGILCDGGELLESSDRHVFGQRFYNADLYLTELRFLEQIEGVLYIPGVGSVRWTGTDTGIQTLSVPGDRSTGIGINSGANLHFYPSGGGSIVLAGRTTENFDTGDFFATGSNPQFDLCALLA
jgi:hypothetical protein